VVRFFVSSQERLQKGGHAEEPEESNEVKERKVVTKYQNEEGSLSER
jgi:hypothetical protein